MKIIFLLSFFILLILLLSVLIWKCFIEYYHRDDPMLHELKEILREVHPKVDQIRFFKGDKSYTINKKKIYLCLKDENDNYYSKNMLIYVALHELAHVLNNEIGHTPKFYDIFDDLLEKAASRGIYNPSIPPLKNYCEF